MAARDVESLILMMSADVRRLERSLDQGQRKFDKTADAIERRQRQLDRNLANLGRDVGNFARPVQAASTIALGAIVGFSIQASRRAEAVGGAFTQTFRDMPTEAQTAVTKVADEFGRLETDVKENFTQMRSVLTALGVDATQSLRIVDQLERRSLDIGAFANVSDAEAFRAVMSGITGETEPLKRFGIVVNETAVKAELLSLGFKGNASQASESAKAIARANIIMRQSAEMHGQVARESDQLAEQEKRTRAEFTKAAEDFGRKFLPVAKDVLIWATNALEAFNDLPEGTQAAGLGMLALVAASGPIASVISGLRAVIGAAVAARAALIAVGTAKGAGGAAAGAAGAGAIAGGASRLIPGVAAVTSVLALSGDTSQQRLQGQARINAQLREEARVTALIGDLRSRGDVAEARRQEAYRGRVQALRTQAQQEGARATQAAADPTGGAAAAAAAAVAGLGDFGLSEAQRGGTGGGGGGSSGRRTRAASGPTAAELSAQREMLGLQGRVEVLQAQGREAEAATFQRRIDIINLTKTFTEAGIADAATAATAQVDAIARGEAAQRGREAAFERTSFFLEVATEAMALQNEMAAERVQFEAELARLSGDPMAIQAKERELYIAERVNFLLNQRKGLITEAQARQQAEGEYGAIQNAQGQGDLRDGARDAARSFVDVIRSENLWEAAGQRFRNAAFDNLENLFATIFRQFGTGGDPGGIGNILSGILGKRALGGPVMAGRPYIVGERRPEVFVPQTGGTIIPSVNAVMSRAQKGGARAAPAPQPILFDLRGAVMTEDIMARVNAVGAEAAHGAVSVSSRVIPAQQARAKRYTL